MEVALTVLDRGDHADCISVFESWFVPISFTIIMVEFTFVGVWSWASWKMRHAVWIDGRSLIVSMAFDLDSAIFIARYY